MATATHARVSVDLACGHTGPDCLEMAWKLHRQLSDGYTNGMATLNLDEPFDRYLAEHRTARKRAAHALRLGYRLELVDRHDYEDDIYRINTSKAERQGRPMSDGYREQPKFGPNPVRCSRHHVYTYGVLTGHRLVAYLWLYRVGELALVSSILGHGEHLRGNVMYALAVGAIEHQSGLGGTMVYNKWASGTEGLVYYKTRLGFVPSLVEWLQ